MSEIILNISVRQQPLKNWESTEKHEFMNSFLILSFYIILYAQLLEKMINRNLKFSHVQNK